MRYRNVGWGINIELRPKWFADRLIQEIASRVAREAIIIYFKVNDPNISVSYTRAHFEEVGRLKPRGYPYNKEEA